VLCCVNSGYNRQPYQGTTKVVPSSFYICIHGGGVDNGPLRGYGEAGVRGCFLFLYSRHKFLTHPACGIPFSRKRARAVVN